MRNEAPTSGSGIALVANVVTPVAMAVVFDGKNTTTINTAAENDEK